MQAFLGHLLNCQLSDAYKLATHLTQLGLLLLNYIKCSYNLPVLSKAGFLVSQCVTQLFKTTASWH